MSDADQKPGSLGVRQAAEILEVHPNTVRNWHRDGILKGTKLPGSGYLRFRRSDVELLTQERRKEMSDLARGRSAIGPELVDAGQLHQWAEQKFADPERNFPELLRRLLQTTPGISGLAMAAGKSVSFGGWDGIAQSLGTSYLPSGSLAFEIGVDADPAAKALKEFRKRAVNGPETADLTFVFVTPRLWSGKHAWARKRRDQSVFADVRVLDADDIAGWLTTVPDVHIWASELLGRQPRDAKTIERWWEGFSGQTAPPLDHSLFLVGRAGVASDLRSRLADGPSLVTVAGRSRNEALAVIAAVAESTVLDRPWVVVESASAWDRLTTSHAPGSVLIPLFEGCEVGRAVDRGHHVIEVEAETRVMRRHEALILPSPPRDAVADVFRRSPWSYDMERAHALAGTFHRSFESFLRAVALARAVRVPPWSDGEAVRTLAPLALIGSWDVPQHRDSEVQTAAIARAVGLGWEAIEACVIRWSQHDDPPFVRAGATWNIADVEDVLGILAPRVTVRERGRWSDLAVEILTDQEPSSETSQSTRLPGLSYGPRHRFGASVRQGIARSLAFLGASDLVCAADGVLWSELATVVVQRVLASASADESGRTWQSLSDVLPLLAEAAPSEFLDAVSEDLESSRPLLPSMFRAAEDANGIFGASSPHTGLLWALEVLCWSGEHLEEAGMALAALASVAPRTPIANCPADSLRTVLIGWARNTSASVPQKLDLIDRICGKFPSVGWDLICGLWPEDVGSCSFPASPRFRDWRPESPDADDEDRRTFESRVVDVGVAMASAEWTERLTWVIAHLGPLDDCNLGTVFAHLEELVKSGGLDSEAQLQLWDGVRAERLRFERQLSRHGSATSDALDRLRALETLLTDQERPERFAHLFAWCPISNEAVDLGRREADHHFDQLRLEAVEEVWAALGAPGIDALAKAAPDARFVGDALGLRFGDAPELMSVVSLWATAPEDHLRRVVSGWAAARVRAEESTLFISAVLERTTEFETKVNLALATPPDAELWDILERRHPELLDEYWRRVRPVGVAANEVERASAALVSRGRGGMAAEVAASALTPADTGRTAMPSDELLLTVLHANQDAAEPVDRHAIEVIIEELRARDIAPATLAPLELRWLPLMRYGWKPHAVYSVLADDPGTFVEFVSMVYRGDGDDESRSEPAELGLVRRIWTVLHRWDRVPGLSDDGSVDQTHLIGWIENARKLFRDARRTDIGDDQIGQILSASPLGRDGIWPAEAVRHAIETTASKNLDVAFVIGVRNRRGVTTRGVLDGGDQERDLADRYFAWGQALKGQSPRTARLLRKIGEAYREDARSHDEDAAERHGAL